MISGSGDDGSVVLNLPYWLSRATLDVIGEGKSILYHLTRSPKALYSGV